MTLVGLPPEMVAGARTPRRALTDVLPDGHHHTLEGQDPNVDAAVLAPVVADFFAG